MTHPEHTTRMILTAAYSFTPASDWSTPHQVDPMPPAVLQPWLGAETTGAISLLIWPKQMLSWPPSSCEWIVL